MTSSSEKPECSNCEGENTKGGYVELWDGKCPDCGRQVEPYPCPVEKCPDCGSIPAWQGQGAHGAAYYACPGCPRIFRNREPPPTDEFLESIIKENLFSFKFHVKGYGLTVVIGNTVSSAREESFNGLADIQIDRETAFALRERLTDFLGDRGLTPRVKGDIAYQVGNWYLRWKTRDVKANLGFAAEELKLALCDRKTYPPGIVSLQDFIGLMKKTGKSQDELLEEAV